MKSSLLQSKHPSSVVQFWRKLDECVHPDDQAVFDRFIGVHTFNLDYPPPAFIGDIDRAPVILLMANGGYHPEVTAAEFAAPDAAAAYRRRLYNPEPIGGSSLAQYYSSVNYGDRLADGTIALVNAVAYRSPRLSKEPHNKELLPYLSSVRVHRQWLREEVLPDVQAGRRMVVVHRGGHWGLDLGPKCPPELIRSPNPASRNLAINILDAIDRFVERKGSHVR